ncbi:MAG: hypothetical protein AAB036_12240, partial [Elusimicrobiota bacterium]
MFHKRARFVILYAVLFAGAGGLAYAGGGAVKAAVAPQSASPVPSPIGAAGGELRPIGSRLLPVLSAPGLAVPVLTQGTPGVRLLPVQSVVVAPGVPAKAFALHVKPGVVATPVVGAYAVEASQTPLDGGPQTPNSRIEALETRFDSLLAEVEEAAKNFDSANRSQSALLVRRLRAIGVDGKASEQARVAAAAALGRHLGRSFGVEHGRYVVDSLTAIGMAVPSPAVQKGIVLAL